MKQKYVLVLFCTFSTIIKIFKYLINFLDILFENLKVWAEKLFLVVAKKVMDYTEIMLLHNQTLKCIYLLSSVLIPRKNNTYYDLSPYKVNQTDFQTVSFWVYHNITLQDYMLPISCYVIYASVKLHPINYFKYFAVMYKLQCKISWPPTPILNNIPNISKNCFVNA